MIYILTIHHRTDRWIAPQLEGFSRHINEPYRVHAVLGEVESDRFDRVVTARSTKHADRLDALADDVLTIAAPDDLLIFCDSDAFPITDPLPTIWSALDEGATLVAVRRDEDGVRNWAGPWPHPSFCAVRAGTWKEIGGTWQTLGYHPTGLLPDCGSGLLKLSERDGWSWTPLLRTNWAGPPLPVYHAIYGGIIYHHGSGSRTSPKLKNDEALAAYHDQVYEALRVDTDFWRGLGVTVIVPYRDAGCGWREPARAAVVRHLERILPAARIVVSDAGGEMFNKSASINQAVRDTVGDVIVMCDADSLVPAAQLHEAIDLAREAPGLVQPFDHMIYTDQGEARRLWHRPGRKPRGQRWDLSKKLPLVGTVNVLSRQTWKQAGGWPEQFVGWGPEDVAFAARCGRVAPLRRLAGPVAHLYHPKKGDYYARRTRDANARRFKQMTAPENRSRYLILCAGPGKRWTGRDKLTATPKHFVPLLGEPLLERTIRLIRERDPNPDIRIVVSDLTDDRYRIPGTKRVTAKSFPELAGLEKIVSAKHVWNRSGRTVIMPGDVYYTTAAADVIVPFDGGEWTLFGRPGGSKFTGKKWTESFACVFWPDDHDAILAGIDRSQDAQMTHNGKLLPHSWSPWYRAMIPWIPDKNLGDLWFWPPDTVKFGHYIPIDDATDDIDSPAEWERWCLGYAKASEKDRARYWH